MQSYQAHLHNRPRTLRNVGCPPYFKEIVDHETAEDNVAEIVDEEHDGDEVDLFAERDKS